MRLSHHDVLPRANHGVIRWSVHRRRFAELVAEHVRPIRGLLSYLIPQEGKASCAGGIEPSSEECFFILTKRQGG